MTAALVLVLAALPMARAADHVVLGKKILVTEPTGDPVRRRVVGLAATFWWKTRSVRTSGPELVGSLPPG